MSTEEHLNVIISQDGTNFHAYAKKPAKDLTFHPVKQAITPVALAYAQDKIYTRSKVKV